MVQYQQMEQTYHPNKMILLSSVLAVKVRASDFFKLLNNANAYVNGTSNSKAKQQGPTN